ncbi:hypothetical protein ACFQX7_01235 [Luedemannella flava]
MTVPGRREARTVHADVRYTVAFDEPSGSSGWPEWHVKIYRCADQGDTEALRLYLCRQALAVQQANARVSGPVRMGIKPPWAVVPVHIVRGDLEEESFDGSVATRIAADPERLLRQAQERLPAWFAADPEEAGRTLLAISPMVDKVDWEPVRDEPATEQLAKFLHVAEGLDTLHASGTVHRDIKPANMCRYPVRGVSQYVLVDADAASGIDVAPTLVRSNGDYASARVRRWRRALEVTHQPPYRLDANSLLAHDRFGFAMVVLGAITGVAWVHGVLLAAEPDGPRLADDPAQVREILRRQWPDTPTRSWQPLIDVLLEPLDPAVAESVNWRTADWLARLVEAEKRCHVTTAGMRTALPAAEAGEVRRFSDELRAIQRTAREKPVVKLDLVGHGCQVVEAAALRVAVHAARRTALASAGTILAVTVILLYSAYGLGK